MLLHKNSNAFTNQKHCYFKVVCMLLIFKILQNKISLHATNP